jgi:hypothetical protein
VEWGDPAVVLERLGPTVKDVTFDRDLMTINALSPQHVRYVIERTAGPIYKLVQSLATADPARLELFRQEFDALAEQYFEMNTMRQSYLLTRATKV